MGATAIGFPLIWISEGDAQKRVGSGIKRCRQAKGWTQRKLAEAMGMVVQHVQFVEGGKANLGIDSILKFAKALGVDPREFW